MQAYDMQLAPPGPGPAPHIRAGLCYCYYSTVLVNAEHYGRAGANPPSLTVRDHVYTCRLVPCFFPQLNCHHGHVTVPVDIGILLLYIYNYAHLVFNEIT